VNEIDLGLANSGLDFLISEHDAVGDAQRFAYFHPGIDAYMVGWKVAVIPKTYMAHIAGFLCLISH
jgi:hypothetical protein